MENARKDAFLYALADGKRVLIRPVGPEDRERIRVGVAQLSPNSRYLRFFAGGTQLTDEQLRRLTEVDQVNHVAWGALDPMAAGEPGLGLGRFVRLEREPEVAEMAIAVIDSCQRRGLGRVLLALLYGSALKAGVRVLRGLVLPENVAVSDWFGRLGAGISFSGGVNVASLPVEADLDRLPDNPSGRRFRDVLEDLRRAMDRA